MNCSVNLSDSIERVAPKKWNQASVEAFAAEYGYKVTGFYKGARHGIEMECPSGHQRTVVWSSFCRGHRCAVCAGKVTTHDQVKRAFEVEGFKVLSEYKNVKTLISFECPLGHQHQILWGNFLKGVRCMNCAGRLVTHEQVEEAFLSKGYRLLSHYKDAKSRLQYECPNGHQRGISWDSFRRGRRCAECVHKVVTQVQVEKAFEAEGYKLLSIYEKNSRPLRFECPNGHYREITWASFNRGYRCSACMKSGYKPSAPATLYYAQIESIEGRLWKIGITNRSARERLSGIQVPYKILMEMHFDNGNAPMSIEKKILEKHQEHRYRGRALKNGNTECFTIDVLGLGVDVKQLELFL